MAVTDIVVRGAGKSDKLAVKLDPSDAFKPKESKKSGVGES